MKNNIFRIIALLVLVSSCDDYLDVIPNGSNTEKWIWSTRNNVKETVNGIYNSFEQDYDIVGPAFLESATDDAFHASPSASIQSFINGTWSPTNIPYNIWKDRYDGIRKANYIIANIDAPVVEGESLPTPFTGDFAEEKNRLKGEAYFLKTLLYFDIAKNWGGGFIVSEDIYTLEDINEVIALQQVSFDEMANYIVEQCNKAIALLPSNYSGGTAGLRGRATKAAAQALKARTLLYAASPLYNEANSAALWIAAANAANDVRLDSNYGLVKSNTVDQSYYDIFRKPYTKEVLFASKVESGTTLEDRNFPPSLQGQSYTQPSNDLVKAFPMANGEKITAPSSGYDSNAPYANRDPRFYAFILYNGAEFQNSIIESYQGGKDGPEVSFTSSKTGYYLKKMMSKNVNLVENRGDKINTVLFRYAEVLLNYAEAMNEAYGPETDLNGNGETALSAINKIRDRVGAGLVPSGLTMAQFREIIKTERRIELSFEGHRYYDVRRWKEGEIYLNKPLEGVKIVKNVDNSFTYTSANVQPRIFSSKMYLFPFPYSEVVKFQGNLTQNTGW